MPLPRSLAARLGGSLLLAALAASLVTLAALEGGPVGVLVTRPAEGGERRTHVWVAEAEGAFWIESATDSRPFFLDLAGNPEVALELRDGPLGPHRRVEGVARAVPEPGGHRKIREFLRQRYGWADRWIALLQDTSASRAVILEPR